MGSNMSDAKIFKGEIPNENSKAETVILELESRQLGQIKEVSQSSVSMEDFGSKLQNIILEGSKEFKEKTGRNMSYAEMRAAWG